MMEADFIVIEVNPRSILSNFWGSLHLDTPSVEG
jgi:hypothetical protein